METRLIDYATARSRAEGGGVARVLFDWIDSYPMNPHAELGRAGSVCPFTRKSRQIDAMRMGICMATPDDEDEAFAAVRGGFVELEKIPAKRGLEQFRTVVLAFPNCDSEEGLAMLHSVQKRHKYYAALRFRMMGFMHPHSESEGLWNPEFRPLRAPMPVLAIRYLVEQDAPFIAGHHMQWPPYLLRYRFAGVKRLVEARRGRRATAGTASG